MIEKNIIKWYNEAVKDLENAYCALNEAQILVNRAEEKLHTVKRLFVLEGGDLSDLGELPSFHHDDIVDDIENILIDENRPMRIGEIRTALVARGIAIPGKGTDANLITRINRSNGRIVRIARGLYDIKRKDSGISR
ncbi:MAG: hypothetical protein JJE36_04485 [Coriobacteriia bacterium]|nr:hypothetical protein [Coriobacteriia bacterium]